MNILKNTAFSGIIPKLRVKKGDKKRPVIVLRPSLKQVNSRLKRVKRSIRELKSELKRTVVLATDRQQALNGEILRLRRVGEGVKRYVDVMHTERPEIDPMMLGKGTRSGAKLSPAS